MQHILIVEDDLDIQDLLRNFLQEVGYEMTIASDGMEAIALFSSAHFDLILLDIMLPKIDGFTLCELIRKQSQVPIIMLTALNGEEEQIRGLDLQVDDYITKPFGVMELISRVKAMLRRSQKSQEKDKVLKLGNIVLDREKHSVTVGKEPVELTYKEYELLKLLMTNAGIVTTRELILDRVWGIDFEGESRTLDMHIKTLRQKLKEEGSLIKTVRNVGYIMNGEKA